MRACFRRSPRPLVVRFFAVSAVAGLLLWLFTPVSWLPALLISAAGAGAWALAAYLRSYHRRCICVDDEGIEQRYDGLRTAIRWSEAAGVFTREADVRWNGATVRVRYAVVADAAYREIGFFDMSPLSGTSSPVSSEGGFLVSDVADAEILLAICAARTGNGYLVRRLAGADPLAGAASADDLAALPAPAPRPAREGGGRRLNLPGLGLLAVKIGSKLSKAAGSALTTVKPGFALASGAVYGVLFSWKFAVALMLMLLVHEYGHVHAMRRSGMRVRGIYFIPLLGAAAVTDDAWATRRQQAYIALNGPLWGAALTLVPALLLPFVPARHGALLGAVAAWWAFINLFNLLPINPLDGGRLLSAVASSISGRLGRALSLAAFAACLLLAVRFGMVLFAMLGVIGLFEFLAESDAAARGARLRLLPDPRAATAEGLAALRGYVRPLFRAGDEERVERAELARARALLKAVSVAPMSLRAAAAWTGLYLALTGALVAVVLLLRDRPGTGIIHQILG